MTAEEVAKLKNIKAQSSEKSINLDPSSELPLHLETIDGRTYPKGTEAVGIKSSEGARSIDTPQETDYYYPPHADFEYRPHLEPKSQRKPKFIDREVFLSNAGARTIFGADQRKVFNSTAFPWRCIGRVESALGHGSGVMIGPRHVLTCAHIIDWQPNNATGWLKFTPMYYNGSAPYGTAFGIKTYYKHKVAGPTIDSTEVQYDYAVVVLDRYIGNRTGWMGTKAYTDSWDGQA